MENRKLKKSVIYGIYSLMVIALVGTIYLVEKSISNAKFKDSDYVTRYVSTTIFDESIPVIAADTKIIRPYNDENVKIVKNFYDYKGDAENQKNSIFMYEDTYMQSSGVSYGGVDSFDVLSVLDGTVISVEEDEVLGNVVQIKHSNDLISVYQSLKDVKVKMNDNVKQGDVIGTSGPSNIDTSLGNHLYFELISKSNIVNPELYYDKTVNELQG